MLCHARIVTSLKGEVSQVREHLHRHLWRELDHDRAPGYLAGMTLAHLDRILAFVCDVIDLYR